MEKQPGLKAKPDMPTQEDKDAEYYKDQLDAAIDYIKFLERYEQSYRKLQGRQKELCKECKKVISECYQRRV